MSVSIHLYSFCPKSNLLQLRGMCQKYLCAILFNCLGSELFFNFTDFPERRLK